MNINKYNANYNNQNGKEARGTDKYTSHKHHRYAAIAAAFAIIVGGIGGSVALGKKMDKNSQHFAAVAAEITTTAASTSAIETAAVHTTTATTTTSLITTNVASAATEPATAEMTAFVETTAPEEITTAASDKGHGPADMDAFAQEWLDNYNEWLKIPNGYVEHEEESVSFKIAEGSYVPAIDAWKITDEEYCSADAINKHLHAFWAPGSKDDIVPAELTEKIDNGTVSYNDFLSGIYFTYKNDLYSRKCNSWVEGRRTCPSAEKLNDNEILVRFTLGYEGVTEQQTMHLVWVDELNDWRVDDIFFEGE
ncbi:hypothetical protein [Ruminococcus sp.]|uniref:hypothetical protein n=1 Tax=Ruminococcus sp. TaxID=41978 RepID=UPI0025E53F39|nr:hypothetical protein [Ruminococcus sp.]MCR4638283.1 hypothetical protein [Ruminococcus sp.]